MKKSIIFILAVIVILLSSCKTNTAPIKGDAVISVSNPHIISETEAENSFKNREIFPNEQVLDKEGYKCVILDCNVLKCSYYAVRTIETVEFEDDKFIVLSDSVVYSGGAVVPLDIKEGDTFQICIYANDELEEDEIIALLSKTNLQFCGFADSVLDESDYDYEVIIDSVYKY